MIELKNIRFSYGKEIVLDDVNLQVKNGQFIGLIGRNGAGKTTLLKVLLHLLKPQEGQVIDDFKRSSFLSQVTGNNDMVFPATVREVVSLGLKWQPLSFMRRSDWDKVNQALTLMGVEKLANRAISALSGGEQQRVRLAKALISDPDLLILDEPTTGMDVSSRTAFLKEVAMLHHKYGKTIVFVSHFYEDLKGADKIYELQDGLVREKHHV